jgi:phospholipase D1/2
VPLIALGLTLAWRELDPKRVVSWAHAMGGRPWAPLIVLFAYTPGCWIMFPRPLITLFAVLAFGPWLGFTYSLAGLVIAALFTYGAGYTLNPQRVLRLMGPRLTGIVEVLRRRGLLAMTAMRLVPLAPFSVEGLAAGALGIKLWHFALGSLLGLLPGTLASTVFADQVQTLLEPGSPVNWPLIGATVLVLGVATWYVRRWFTRQQTDSAT